jgi:ribosomal protein L20A (L18A)
LIRAATQRDEMVRNCLSDKEKQVLERALSKIAGEARALIQIEKALK